MIEDIKHIEGKWNKIIQTSINPKLNKAKLLYKSEDIIEKILMDLTEKEVKIIEEKDAFHKYDIDKQIEK